MGYSNEEIEKMIESYQSGLSANEIARKFSISKDSVYNLFKKHNIILRNQSEAKRLSSQKDNPLSEKALSIIEGELLGDGYLRVSKFQAHFRLRTTDYNYAKWVADELYNNGVLFKNEERIKIEKSINDDGSLKTVYVVITSSTIQLMELYKKWYVDGIKHIPKDLELDAIKLLHWWIGDGSVRCNGCSVVFCTDCFDKEDHKILIKLIKNKFDLNAEIRQEKHKYLRLYLFQQSQKFIDIIGNCPFETMLHKWEVRLPGKTQIMIDITPEELEYLYIDLNMTAKAIAEKIGCKRGTVYDKARSLGLKKEPNKKAKCFEENAELSKKVIEMVNDGITLKDIALKINIGKKRILSILINNGIERKKLSSFWVCKIKEKENNED